MWRSSTVMIHNQVGNSKSPRVLRIPSDVFEKVPASAEAAERWKG